MPNEPCFDAKKPIQNHDKSNERKNPGYGKSKAPTPWDKLKNCIRYNPIVQGMQNTLNYVTIPFSTSYTYWSSQTQSKKLTKINGDDEMNDKHEINNDNMNVNETDDAQMRNCEIQNVKVETDEDDYDENDQHEMNNDNMNDNETNDAQMRNNEMNHDRINQHDVEMKNIEKKNIEKIEMNEEHIKSLLSQKNQDKLRDYDQLKLFRTQQYNKIKDTIKNAAAVLCVISEYGNKSDNIDGNALLKEQFIDLFKNDYKYHVFYPNKDSLTKEEAKTFLTKTKEKIINDGCYDGLIVIVAGHGRSQGLVCSDNTKKDPSLLLFEDELFDTFSGDTFMVGKPKIFWIDCCLGTDILKTKNKNGKPFDYKNDGQYLKLGPPGDDNSKSENIYFGPRTDFLIHWSNLKGYISFGFGEGGRSALCHALYLELKLAVRKEYVTITDICDKINEYVNGTIGGIQSCHYHNHLTGTIKIESNIHDKDKIY